MKQNFLKCYPLLSGLLLGMFYLTPASAIPLEPGAQIVADPQLQACLDQAANANNWTTTEEITALNCPSRSIESVDGIGQLTNLVQLNLSDNLISKTNDLGMLTQLTALDLSANRLIDIASLIILHDLQQLNLSGNTLLTSPAVEAVIQNNTGLTHLGVADIPLDNVTHNWLPPVGPQGEYDLIELDISRTGQYIDLYPITEHPNLMVLKASGIHLHLTGPLDQLQRLEALDLSNNKLIDLSGLQMAHGLKQLNLSGNVQLPASDVRLVLQNNPGLTHLSLAEIALGDDLSWLPAPGSLGEYNLTELDISHTGRYLDLNPLMQYTNLIALKAAGIKIRRTGPFDQLQHLETLDLSANNLADLQGLQPLHTIHQLNLNGNSRLQASDIRMLIKNNPGLTHLNVADINLGNDFNWLPAPGPQGEYDLVELDISRTGFHTDLFPLLQYPHLRVLKAAGNRTEYIGPLDQFQQLEVVDVSDNNLAHPYDLIPLHTLRQLNIGGNPRLKAPDALMVVQNNPYLTHLGVADIAFGNELNWLPAFGPQGEYNFADLDISRTGQYFDIYPLTQYPNLRKLQASGNQIETTGPLDQFLQLETLNLSNNNLKDLIGVYSLNKLQQLNLSGNPDLTAEPVQILIQNSPDLTHLQIADIFMGNDLGWLPSMGPQGEFNLLEVNISRTGQYSDLTSLTQYPNLTVLQAAGNQLQSTGALEQLQQLETLDLSNNSLNNLNGVLAFDKLQQLNLSGNHLLQAPDVQTLIQKNPALTHLGVADIAFGNDLNWLPQPGPQGEHDLIELDINHTGLYFDLNPVSRYANLHVLNAVGNQIQSSGPLSQLQHLEALDLSDNQLTDISGLHELFNLHRLNLNGNANLLDIDVQPVIFNNPGLTHLGIADIPMGSDLMWLPMSYESRYMLIELDISRIAEFVDLSPIGQYSNLRSLKAVGLQLQTPFPIEQLTKLEILDLRDNRLGHVDILASLATLKLLDLRGNNHISCDELDYLEISLPGIEFYRPLSCVYLNPPVVNLLKPVNGGQFFSTDSVNISADANDVEDGDLSNAIEWSSNLDGVIGIGQQLTVSFSAGQQELTATVTDSHGNKTFRTVNLTVLPNTPPVLSLLQPNNGGNFNTGDPILFIAEANDAEEGDLSPFIIWTSNLDGVLGTIGTIQLPLSAGQHTITASITDATGATVEKTVQISVNSLPELSLLTPLNGSIYQQGENVLLSATAYDLEDGNLSAKIVWTSNLDGALGAGAQLNPNLSNGAHSISAVITDSKGASVTKTVTITVNTAPQITLQSPADGGIFMLQEAIEMHASAIDPESGDISASIAWSSDIDGNLGSGAILLKPLSLGAHTLTATITDGDGGVASVSTQVTVKQIGLSVTISGKGKRKTANLSWSNSRTSVDIYMDNSVVNVAPSSGSLQLTFKNTAVFKVCETGTNYCSPDVLAQ